MNLAAAKRSPTFDAGRERIRTRRYGVIETVGGRLRGDPPAALAEAGGAAGDCGRSIRGIMRRATADRCLLYYNQPWRMPNFLALKYIVSTAGTQLRHVSRRPRRCSTRSPSSSRSTPSSATRPTCGSPTG